MKELSKMTFHEKLLRHIIICYRNDFIGGRANAYSDYGEEEYNKMYPTPLTKEDVVNYIYGEIMNGNDQYVTSPHDNISLEKKHIKFLGSDFIRELIEDRVQADYEKNGWDFPNNYNGSSK